MTNSFTIKRKLWQVALLMIVALLNFNTVFSQTTVTLTANNVGTVTSAGVQASNLNTIETLTPRRGWFTFDVSSLAGATVVSANLIYSTTAAGTVNSGSTANELNALGFDPLTTTPATALYTALASGQPGVTNVFTGAWSGTHPLVLQTNGPVGGNAGAITALTNYVTTAIAGSASQVQFSLVRGSTNSYSFQTPQLVITYNPAVPCSGTPNPGTTLSSAASVCVGANFGLSMSNATTLGSGVTFQWQSSPNGSTWTNIPSAISSSLVTNQSVATYYQCVVTCTNSGLSATSTPLQINMNPFYSCYCIPTTTNGCAAGDHITNVTFSSAANPINNSTGACLTASYSDYTGLTPAGVTQLDVVNVSVSVNNGGTEFAAGWIDYDQSGTFDATEFIALSDADGIAPWIYTGTTTIPVTALTGITGMRFRSSYNAAITSGSACSTYSYGETEDYRVNIAATSACLGTPSPGNTISSSNPVCPGVNFTLSLQNTVPGSGISYQWQSSPDGSTWSNVGTNATTFTTSQITATYYQCIVTCATSGLSATSTPVQVTMNSFLSCYCTPTYTTGTGFGDYISLVQLESINNATGASATPYYTYYSGQQANLSQGVSYTITLSAGTYTINDFAVWIDYDHSGTFDDATEKLGQIDNQGAAPATGNISFTVPLTAQLGLTRMRVREADQAGLIPACGGLTYGEVEDYDIDISLPPVCLPPSGLTSSSITANSADITWNCSGCTGTFGLEWGPAGFTPGTGTFDGNATSPYPLTGLTSQTSYDVYVYQDCSGPLSPTSFHSFTTLFDPCATIPTLTCGVAQASTVPSGGGAWNLSGCGFTTPGKESVFTYTPASSGTVTLTLNSNSVGWLDFFFKNSISGCNSAGWTCIDDLFGAGATANFAVTAGTTYYIVADPEGTAGGNFNFTISCPTAPPANDNCVDVTPVALTNGTPQTFTGNTSGATANGDETTILGGAAVYEAVTLSGTCNNLTITYCGNAPALPTVFIVYQTACNGAFTAGAFENTSCGDGNYTVNFTNLPAGTYYLPVYAVGTQGPYTMTVTSVDCPAPPANDECLTATAITCPSSNTGQTNISATQSQAPEACSGFTSTTANDVWYSFVADGISSYTISEIPVGAFDGIVGLYSGSCGSLSLVNCSDNTFNGGTEVVTSGILSAGTYYVRVYGWGTSTGNFTLDIACATPPANDICAGATPILCGGTASGNTLTGGYTPEVPSPACGYSGANGAWYVFAGDGSTVTASLCGSGYDTRIAAFSGSCGALTCILNNDDFCGLQSQVTFPTVSGTNYYILVSGFGTDAGAFTLNVTCTTPPVNDPCSGAIAMTCGQTVTGNTATGGFTPEAPAPPACGYSGANGAWYSFVSPGGNVRFSLCGSAYDTRLDIFTGTCGALACANFNDDFCGAQSEITMMTTAGTTYYILVSGFGGGSGAFTLNVACLDVCTWLGTTQDWATTSNWSCGVLPICGSTVIIPSTANDPVIAAPANAGNVIVANGVDITLNGADLTVCGNWTSSGSTTVGNGNVIMVGSGAAQTVTGTTQFQLLTINNASGVNLVAPVDVSVAEGLNLQLGNYNSSAAPTTLLSTAALTAYVNDFAVGYSGTFTGNVNAQRFVSNGVSNDQHFISSPVTTPGISELSDDLALSGADNVYVTPSSNCSADSLASGSNYGNVFEWDENVPNTSCLMSGWKVRSAGSLPTAEGFSAYLQSGSTFDISGTPTTGNQSVNLTNTGYGNGVVSGYQTFTVSSGWNLVGNPFPSSMVLTNLPAGIDPTIQVWQTSGVYQGTYLPQNIGTASLAPFQGFFMRTLNPSNTYTFLQSDRSTNQVAFYSQDGDHTLQLDVNGNGFADFTVIDFKSSATSTYDLGLDAEKFLSRKGQPTIYSEYTTSEFKPLSKNTLTSVSSTSTVPVGLIPGNNGQFTINATKISTFDPTTYIILEDKLTNTMQDLRQNPSYGFTSATTDASDRFVVHFTPPVQIASIAADCQVGGKIELVQPGSANWNYAVTNANNALVGSGVLNQASPVSVSGLPAGVYTITLVDNNGYTVVKNVIVNGAASVVANFTPSNNNPLLNESVVFTSSSTNAQNYEWNFGDGTIINGVANPSYSYQEPGTYTVTLTVTSPEGCTNVFTQTVIVQSVSSVGNLTQASIDIFSVSNKVVVEFNGYSSVDAQIKIYNVIGQEVSNEHFTKGSVYSKELSKLDAAYMFVTVKQAGQTTTRKVFITSK